MNSTLTKLLTKLNNDKVNFNNRMIYWPKDDKVYKTEKKPITLNSIFPKFK